MKIVPFVSRIINRNPDNNKGGCPILECVWADALLLQLRGLAIFLTLFPPYLLTFMDRAHRDIYIYKQRIDNTNGMH